jgi:hypothetical protein
MAEAKIGRWMKKPTTGAPRLYRKTVSRRGMLRIRRPSYAS